MKTKAEILEILRREKPELVRRYGLKRLTLFGSYAREDQREDSDVDILVEIDPQIGLSFVELADRIEDALVVRTEVVSRRAIKPRYWEIIKEDRLMSRRATPFLVEDIGPIGLDNVRLCRFRSAGQAHWPISDQEWKHVENTRVEPRRDERGTAEGLRRHRGNDRAGRQRTIGRLCVFAGPLAGSQRIERASP